MPGFGDSRFVPRYILNKAFRTIWAELWRWTELIFPAFLLRRQEPSGRECEENA